MRSSHDKFSTVEQRSLHHRAMTTPASFLLTTPVHITPSYWTIFRSLKLFSKWELSTGLDFIFSVLYQGCANLLKGRVFCRKSKTLENRKISL